MARLIEKTHYESTEKNANWEKLLPELFKRLLSVSTGGIKLADAYTADGENYRVTGFDGVVVLEEECEGIPAGNVCIEYGATSSRSGLITKANDELKRVEGALQKPDDFAFVMVGRATWSGEIEVGDKDNKKKELWQEKATQDTKFKQVILFDQARLIDWVNRDVDTCLWLLQELGLIPNAAAYGVCSAEERISLWKRRFRDDVSPEILLDGQASLLELRDALLGEQSINYLLGNSDREAAVAACQLCLSSSELDHIPVVCVQNEAGLNLLKKVGMRHIVILEGEAASHPNLLEQHSVLVAKAISSDPGLSNCYLLQRPDIPTFAKHIEPVDKQSAETIAKAAGRNLSALERLRGTVEGEKCLWADPDLANAPLIKRLGMVTAWNISRAIRREDREKPGAKRDFIYKDVEALIHHTGVQTYSEIESIVKKHGRNPLSRAGSADPMFVATSSIVTLNGPVDAFFRLARYYTDDDYDAFEKLLQEVLSDKVRQGVDRDQVFDPSDYSGFSSDFVGGVILTFVLIGIFGEEPDLNLSPHGQKCTDWCRNVYQTSVPQLLDNPQFGATIEEWLPLLAEGVPQPFLESLEAAIEGNAEGMAAVFKAQESKFSFMDFHLGASLLWALERLAWFPEHVEQVCRLLMKLHLAVSPMDDRQGNQPLASLQGILSFGVPQTAADTKQRRKIIRRLASEFGTNVLELLVPLLETRGGRFVMSTSKPIFSRVQEQSLTWGDVYEMRDEAVEQAISVAALNAANLAKLVECLPSMVDDYFYRFIAQVSNVEHDEVGVDELLEALRAFTGRHRQFSNADWAIDDERLTKLEVEFERLQPDDSNRHLWLFKSSWVETFRERTDDPQSDLAEHRRLAVEDIVANYADELPDFLQRVASPFAAGLALAQATSNSSSIMDYILTVAPDYQHDLELIRGMSRGAALGNPDEWVDTINSKADAFSKTVGELIGEGLYNGPTILAAATTGGLPPQVSSGFWKSANAYSFTGDNLSQAVVDGFNSVGRIHDLAHVVANVPSVPIETLRLVAKEYLKSVSNAYSEGRPRGQLDLYHYWELLGIAEDRGALSLKEIAALEFPLAEALRFDGPKRTPAVYRFLAEEPAEFFELIPILYKRDDVSTDETGSESSDEDPPRKDMWRSAFHIMENMNVLPGSKEGHIDDEALMSWVEKLLNIAQEKQFEKGASIAIGQLLSKSPIDPTDHIWPHTAVRKVIEKYPNERLVSAMRTGQFNSRGVISGSMEDYYGKSASIFRQWADKVDRFPHTQSLLRSIAKSDQGWADREADERTSQESKPGIS